MKEIINCLWIGESLSLMEQLSINSFLKNGYEYHLYCYDKIRNVPAGTTLRDAAEILPASEIFCYQHGRGKGSVAAFANLFHFKFLLERGGWWVDADLVCLRPFAFPEPIVIASQRICEGVQPTDVVMKFPPGHAAASMGYEACCRENRKQLKWGKTGPLLVERMVSEHKLESYVKPPEVFCPLDYWDWKRLLDKKPNPTSPLFDDQACAIHLWHEMWRRDGPKVNPTTGRFQPGNVFHELWLKLRGKPVLSFADTTPFAQLLRQHDLLS